ncbi:MAG: hypothetical protein AAGJ46_01130 [Planctomycetota bacterium]
MSFGKSLVGALIGAGVGLGAQAGIESSMGSEMWWFPVVTGALTGLGVRVLDPSVKTAPSYLRGAMAALLGLGGIFGGISLSSKMQVDNLAETSKPIAVQAAAEPAETEDAEETETTDEAAEVEVPEPTPVALGPAAGAGEQKPLVGAPEFSVWNFAMIGLGMFLAYELARGSAPTEDAGEEGVATPEDGPDAHAEGDPEPAPEEKPQEETAGA